MNLLMVNDAIAAVEAMRDEIDWDSYGIDTVYVAYNVIQGKVILQQHPIDILLCDIEMPGDNGLQLIRWIREHGMDVDCILLTCHADFGYAQEAVELDCKKYILLPASYKEIGKTVLNACRERRERIDRQKIYEYGQSYLKEKEKQAENESAAEQRQHTPKQIVDECTQYILLHLADENLSVSALAEHFYLNPIYLNRIFKKENSIALSQFIIRERMTMAARLLTNPQISVREAALQVGYMNVAYFSTVFKNHYGVAPKQYQEQFGGF